MPYLYRQSQGSAHGEMWSMGGEANDREQGQDPGRTELLEYPQNGETVSAGVVEVREESSLCVTDISLVIAPAEAEICGGGNERGASVARTPSATDRPVSQAVLEIGRAHV